MQQQEISFNFKARYFKLGEITSTTKKVWFVIHGYGQLAQFFLKKFTKLQEHEVCVIAPEGLSKYYLENVQNAGRKNDRVGASWMTKENRLMDIQNYLTYLDEVYAKEIGDKDIEVTILGFSQGSATASRWVMNGKVHFNRLILWAGIFPPDMDFETGKQILQDKESILVYGTQDPFLNDSRFTEMKMLTDKLQTNVQQITFDGAHEIHEQTLLNLI